MECLINDLPIYYEEYGSGKPILCVHGYSIDHRALKGCLEPIFQNIAGYRRIYLDLPGMGQTPGMDWVKNADTMLDVLKMFISKVIGDESFLVVGNSYGGYMALGLARDPGLHIDGIFLIAPCVVADSAKRKLPAKGSVTVEEGLEAYVNAPEDFANFLACASVATRETWDRFKSEIMPGINIADGNFLRYFRQSGFSFSFEAELRKLQFEKPIVALTGRQDDSVGYEDTWETLKHLPQLTFVALNNTGHNLQIENVDIFNAHVENWLKTSI